MKYKYNNIVFEGTKEEIIKKLKEHLINCDFLFTTRTCCLAEEEIDMPTYSITSRDIRIKLITQALYKFNEFCKVKNSYNFNGKCFELLSDLAQYLEELPLMYCGSSRFSVGGLGKKFIPLPKLDVKDIKNIIIKEIMENSKLT
ncbi:MAG: hypothetical protein ACFFG0_08295 [Candidatus Thorarchaeota archaeon]